MGTSAIDRNNVEDILALSPLQEGILFHHLSAPGTYCEQISFRLCGFTSAERICEAWEAVGRANQMMRTVFRWEQLEKPVQVILKQKSIPTAVHDLTGDEQGQQAACMQAIRTAEYERGIDLQAEPFRLTLCRLSDTEFEMVLTYHHILFDGWSTGLLLKEFYLAYQSLLSGRDVPLMSKPSYKEFVRWHQRQDRAVERAYWQQLLAGFRDKTRLPVRPGVSSGASLAGGERAEIKALERRLAEEQADALKAFARTQQVTAATVIYAAWALLLGRYNNTADVLFGTTVAGRKVPIRGIDQMTGLFINTPPLRVCLEPRETVSELLRRVERSLMERERFESSPLVEIQAQSELKTQEPLFDSIVVIENYPLDEALKQQGGAQSLRLTSTARKTNFPLVLEVHQSDGWTLEFTFQADLLEEETVARLADHFIRLLSGMVRCGGRPVAELEILSDTERQIVLDLFNQTRTDYAADKTLHQLFEAVAAQNPDALAVAFEAQWLTYRELNERANRLARLLQARGVGPDQLVAVMLERSVEMMVGILAVLKAGGAYVPIDPGYPPERISYLLADCQARWLLVRGAGPADFAGEVLDLTDPTLYQRDGADLGPTSGPHNLAYVIYTSGSTGQPKGAMIEHHMVINRLQWMQKRYPLTATDVILHKTPFSFDVSVWELFWWGMTGASVAFLGPGEEQNPAAISAAVEQHGVSVMHFVPSMLQIFLEYAEGAGLTGQLRTLRRVFASGEALQVAQAHRFTRLLPQAQLVNLYGPTEATVDASYHDCTGDANLVRIPIGRPIDNIALYVVDAHLRLQPVGVPGELCIGGVGVGRGYWKKPELTAEKFVANPFRPGEKMYRTGDLARWLPSGEVEYLGRLDHQVKIRGFRIELGEIEAHLLRHERIREAVVIAREAQPGLKELCAYYVAEGAVSPGELRQFLGERLPAHMVPARFTALEAMPLTPNGKLDRKRLPEPLVSVQAPTEQAKPQGELEEQVATIWREVLQVDAVDVLQTFFELGGNSILMMRAHLRLDKLVPGLIQITDLFTHPTIRQLSGLIRRKQSGAVEERQAEELPFPPGLRVEGAGGMAASGFEWTLEGVLYEAVSDAAAREGVGLYTVLVALYLYYLSDLTGQTELTVDTMLSGLNESAPVHLRFDQYGSFGALFTELEREALSPRVTHSLQELCRNSRPRAGLLPFTYRREALTISVNLLEWYDLVFALSVRNGGVELSFEFNALYLREEGVAELVQGYHEVLRLFVHTSTTRVG